MENEKTALQPIPDYVPEDFYSSSAPYEFLYAFHGDPFVMDQMLVKLKDYATKIGVKGFLKLWNSYKKRMMPRKPQIIATNGTEFSGQPLELFCGRYICRDDGVFGFDKQGNSVTVCVHPILPVRRFVNVDNGKERIEIAFRKGERWRTVIVPKSTICSSQAIIALSDFGISVNSRSANDLSTYLLELEQLNLDEIPEQKSIARLGWIDGHGFSPFEDGLFFDGEADFQHLYSSVSTKGSFEKWREAMVRLRQQKTIGRIALAASFASILVEPCGLLPFIVHLYGTTEFGKTVSLMIAASVWGRPEVGEYITTFNATSAGLEMLAGFLNSMPLLVDELEIQESIGVKDFDALVYRLCEGAGKTRSTKTGGLQKIGTWRNCTISTGENPITHARSKAGAVNRNISVEGTELVVDAGYVSDFCNILRENYGHAGRMFVEYLQTGSNLENVKELQQAYYKALLGTESMAKQAASASVILTADWIISQEILHDEEHQLTMDELRAVMAKKEDVDLNARALEWLYDLAVRQQNRFEPNKWNEFPGEVWGKLDESYIYIIKSVFDKEMTDAGYHPATFLSWASRRGLLRKDAKGKNTVAVRFGSSVTRCVALQRPTEEPDDEKNEAL